MGNYHEGDDYQFSLKKNSTQLSQLKFQIFLEKRKINKLNVALPF